MWFLRYGVRQTEYFVILGHFLPYYPHPTSPPNNQENQWKMKKAHGDVIILHMRTKNHDHMIYASWDMECGKQKFLSFWAIFCHFTSLTTQNFGKMKKMPGDIIHLHMCTINEDHMVYGSRDMEHDRHNFLSFWAIFLPFYTSNSLENQNFEKMKTNGDIILHKCSKLVCH